MTEKASSRSVMNGTGSPLKTVETANRRETVRKFARLPGCVTPARPAAGAEDSISVFMVLKGGTDYAHY